MRTSTVERAFQIARSGTCKSLDDIKRTLVREGCEAVESHLSGTTLKRPLQALMRTGSADATSG